MSGILSKIEAVDDYGPEDGGEAVDVAVDRVFGDPPPQGQTTKTPDSQGAKADLGVPMPPIPTTKTKGAVKPAPPRPRGPRPKIAIEPESKDPELQAPTTPLPKPVKEPQARRSPNRRSEPQKRKTPAVGSTSSPQVAAPKQIEKTREQPANRPTGKSSEKRLPPRMRKRMQQESKTTGDGVEDRVAQAVSPTADKPAEDDKRKVAVPKALQDKPAISSQRPEAQDAAQTPKPPPAPAPTARKPDPPAAPRPAPQTPAMPQPDQSPPTPVGLGPPPMLPSAPATLPAIPAAVAAAFSTPPPILPPPPPTGGGGDGGGDGGRPMPAPDSEPPAHDDNALAALKEATDLSNCMLPLLTALNWRGDRRHIAEALPHFTNSLDITSLRNVMATLHFQSRPVEINLMKIDTRLFPCLFLPENGDAMVVHGYEPDGIRVFDGGINDERVLPRGAIKGTAYFFSPVDADEIQSNVSKVGWFRAVTERFRALIYQTLGITLVLNILALVTPLFVMAVYDKVVATKSLPTLAFFAFGVAVAIGCDLFLRVIRSKIMAFIGARLDNIVGIAIFHKILFLPPAFTERATIGAQVARIKDFETIRDFFTGPMALVLFELPFVIIFVVTIAALAGPVALVSLIMIAGFCILGLIIQPLLRNSVSRAARASSYKQELIVETLSGMRAVKYCGAEARWMERFREFSATSALNSFYTAQLSSLMQTISHVLMISAGLGTIIFGVFRVLNGDMTVGGLVASMILVWRVLAPLQTGFVSLTRLTQVKSSISQINNLMNIKGEREQHTLVNPIKQMEGFVTFARVSIRYSPESDPALVGASFDLEPGEVLCVVGGNGSGKSTVLKLLAGMYAPQAGSIRIDNMDIRQMDTVELRHAVSYVPQTIQFFYGTIAQNLRLSNPTATLEDMYEACERAAVLDDVLALTQGSGKWKRDGFDVRIGDSSSGQMPTSLLQRLNLARGYLKKSPIMLFDEPGNGLDFAGDQAFMRTVDSMRGDTTILMVTHRPSHMKLADKLMWLEHGNVRAFGPSAEVLAQMPKDFV